MTETNTNIELAEHLSKHADHASDQVTARSRLRVEMVEILEAIVLAIVALVTALSGYQAATWDGVSAGEYARSTALNVQAQEAALEANQALTYNAGTVTAWLEAKSAGNERLAASLEDRFTEDYKPAFDAWVKTKPLTNPDSPPGPWYMPQFKSAGMEKSRTLSKRAEVTYKAAEHSRHTGENYVRLTVILAAVLFLIALSQRFKIRLVRWSIVTVAAGFLIYCVVLLIAYPRV